MTHILQGLILLAFCAAIGTLLIFGLNLYVTLALFFLRQRENREEANSIWRQFEQTLDRAALPRVMTQLPLFNECNVAERVLRAAAAMDYPADRHVIQVLDDSTDATRETVDRVAAELKRSGCAVQVVRRENREGFKAGALAHGLSLSDAEYIAVFDADFVPPRDFLLRALAVMLQRPDVGLVQARWGHLNAEESLITRAQAIGIDAHFAIEQPARAWHGLFMNFNGTAGLWRRQAIVDAGGWQSDTLTEDMDLSYRAQLAGWRPFFLFDLAAPAELPADINALKAQQFRWAKGSIQTAVKMLPGIWAAHAGVFVKIQATLHLLHYLAHPLILCVALLALPAFRFTGLGLSPTAVAVLFALMILSTAAPLVLYVASQVVLYPRWWSRLRALPVLTALGIGLAVSNSRAVLEALFGVPSAFIRTPKKGACTLIKYLVRPSYETVLELLVGVYCFATFLLFLHVRSHYLVSPFFLLYGWGFTGVGLLSVLHFLQRERPVRALEENLAQGEA